MDVKSDDQNTISIYTHEEPQPDIESNSLSGSPSPSRNLYTFRCGVLLSNEPTLKYETLVHVARKPKE